MVDAVRSLNLASELSKQAGDNNEEILNSLPKKLSELVHNPLDFQTIQRCNEYLFGNRDKHYSSKFNHDDPRLSKFDPKWFLAKTVLDIGCGDGSLALLIAAKFTPKQIIGVDIDHRLTAKALSNIHDCINNTESIEFISNQIKNGEESKDAKDIQERISKLPKSMQIHISDAGAKNKLMADIKNSKMSQKELKNYLYSKVAFRSENYLASIDPSSDILLKSEKFDLVMCLRTTKFIHLNFGDQGICTLFLKICHQLKPGGLLILEAQPWKSYKQEKQRCQQFKDMIETGIKVKPGLFTKYLEIIGLQLQETITIEKNVAKDYVENMLQETTGRKALIMDQETLMMVSMVYSKTSILQKEVFLMTTIDEIPDEKLTHLKAIFFCRLTEKNVKLICNEISQNPKFSSYNIYFTNKVEIDKIQKIAESDVHNVVTQLQEVYLDYQAVNPHLFTLDIPSVINLCLKQRREWSLVDEQSFDRMSGGLYSILLSVRGQNPKIRYDEGSKICQLLAQDLDLKINKDSQFVEKMSRGSKAGETTILILDRREDPVTPLLNQWTYQAMIHEHLGMHNNRVDLKHLPNLSDEMKEVVLSCEDDEFFRKIMFKNFGDVADSIHELVQKFLTNKKSQAQFNTIEDMQRIIENFPEFKKGERNTTKHFTVLEELRKIVDSRNLYDISEVEQDIISGIESKSKHYKAVEGLITKEEINKLEALRLVLLFALRYEGDDKVKQLRNLLKSQHNIPEEQLNYIDNLMTYAGKDQRRGDLFKDGSMVKNTKKLFNSMFGEDVKNVLLQHKSWLQTSILDQFARGKLDLLQYPFISQGERQGQAHTLIIFMVGGVTYEEAKEVANFSASVGSNAGQFQQITGQAMGGSQANQLVNPKVIIGGTYIHNSKTFLAELFPQKDLQESYHVLAKEMVSEGENIQGSILEQDAIFFGQADEINSSDFSSSTMLALRIKDFADQSNIQLKHPICFECFEEILKQQEYKVKSQEKERDMYKNELETIEKEIRLAVGQTDQDLLKELKELEDEEKELDKNLETVQRDEEAQNKMLEQLQLSKDKIETQEESIWKRVNDYEREHGLQLEQSKQIDGQIENLDKLYKRLRKTNFLNEVFHISCQDQFGTISGFRLGRITQLIEVGWDEVNTALGQSAYLMALIAHRFGYKFDQYKINLCGSMTTIQLKYVQNNNKNQKYELYNKISQVSEDRFNTALEYLLDCLNGLIQDVAAKTSAQSSVDERKIPFYVINGNTIGNISIRWKSSDSEKWTAAMKYFLTNLQWLVYKSQQKDLSDQRENLNMETNSSNFTIAGL